MKKIFLSCWIFVLGYISILAQLIPVESTLPPGIKWQQIHTDTVRVVFPEGSERKADRVAGMVHKMARDNKVSLGDQFRKVDIFLINSSTISNGYVTSAPFHSKFFLQNPQVSFSGSADWLDLLAIHEYRHVLQYANAKHGISKWLYYVFGELAYSGVTHLAVPAWFWEGDAVVQETALSHSGRGRTPSFTDEFQTIANLKKPFSYEKMVCGSYQDWIPDHYVLGYELNLYGRMTYGNDFWEDVYRESSAYKRLFWPFSESIHRKTGKRTVGIYNAMIRSKKMELPAAKPWFMLKKSFPEEDPGQYAFPRFSSDQEIIVIRESFSHESWLVSISMNGEEEKLIPAGFGFDLLDANQNGIVWNEITHHIIWSDVGYSNLYYYDRESGKTRQLSKGSRYFAPKFSPDATRIAAIQTDGIDPDQVVILDAAAGKLLKSYEVPGEYTLTHPCWLDENLIALVAAKENRNGILILNLSTGKTNMQLKPQIAPIQYLSHANGKLYFLSLDSELKNQLFRFDPLKGAVEGSTIRVPYLLDMPAVSSDGLIAFVGTEFNQHNLQVINTSDAFPEERDSRKFGVSGPMFSSSDDPVELNTIVVEEGGPIVDQIPDRNFEKTKYRTGFSRLKLHSWILLPFHPNYSIDFEANDPLSTIGVSLEPGYNINEKTLFTNARLTYGAWYPKYELGFSSLRNRTAQFQSSTGDTLQLNWNENSFSGSVHFPLQTTKRNYYYSIQPVVGYEHIITNGLITDNPRHFNALYFELSGAAIRRKSYRSIRPKNSVRTELAFQKVLGNQDKMNVSAELDLYFPGLHPSHSTVFKLDYRYQNKDNEYLYLDNYYYAGGYDPLLRSDWVAGFRADYAFPLLYPDMSLGPFAFLKRVSMQLFYGADMFGPDAKQGDNIRNTFGFVFMTDARYFRIVDFPVGLSVNFSSDAGQIRLRGLQIVFDNL